MAEGNAFFIEPVSTQRASEAIYEKIRDMIVSKKLLPGDRLPSEREMMDMLHRSRSTIREALRMLERAGLIKIVPGCRGAFVTELTLESVEQPLQTIVTLKNIPVSQLTEFRRATEIIFAEWAAERREPEDILRMRACIDEAAAVTDDYRSFFKKDIEFHHLIALSTKNELATMLSSLVRTLIDNANKERYHDTANAEMLEPCREILRQHEDIFKAVSECDAEAAKAAMTRHLGFFSENME